MPWPRPRGEEQEQPRARVGGHRTPLVRLEQEQRAGTGVERLAPRTDPNGPVHHDHEGVLLDLVVAEALPGLEADQDGSRLVLGVQYHRRAASAPRLDLKQVPPLHGRDRKRGDPLA